MFETLSEKLTESLRRIRGLARITEENIEDTLLEIRSNLLEADVHYQVTKQFLARVKEKALGKEVTPGISPGQQFVKVVYEELCELLGGRSEKLNLKGFPSVIMLVGLQGSGKTTTAGKIALFLARQNRKPYLVPADPYRPAAIEQLLTLADKINLPAFPAKREQRPEEICEQALKTAKLQAYDTLIVDTAGRLHIDQELMEELVRLKKILNPSEVLLVADAMTGQDAVNIAKEFEEKVGISGVVLTKLDGDARGGAALSIKSVVGKPIKLVGVGEKLDALEIFHPDRMAGRILDLGDILTLVEKAEQAFDRKQAEKLQKKLKEKDFTLEDFRDMIQQLKKLGSMQEVLSLLPGMKSQMKMLKNLNLADRELKRAEAIINSMTRQERANFRIINASRRLRIARGSGTTVQQVNRVLKSYIQMRKMMKKFKPKDLERMLGVRF